MIRGRPAQVRVGNCRGTVIVIVLGMVMIVALLLTKFVELAGEDMLLEAKISDLSSLRSEAYSATEVTMATLADFVQLDGALYKAKQGWSDPLGYAGYQTPEGMAVHVTFEDETGKVSLAVASPEILTGMFKSCGLSELDAKAATDGLLVWTRKDYVSTNASINEDAYRFGDPALVPPKRPMRSFAEMASIIGLNNLVCDEGGRPNQIWRNITKASTLYEIHRLNINTVQSSALQSMGWDQTQIGGLHSSLDNLEILNPSSRFTMPALPALEGVHEGVFGTQVEVLAVLVTVEAGNARYRVQTVVRLPTSNLPPAPVSGTPTVMRSEINYPLQVLECSENPEGAPSGPVGDSEI